MRLITHLTPDGPQIGVLDDGVLDEAGAQFAPIPGLTMLELIAQGEAGLEAARRALVGAIRHPLSGAKLLAPIPEPRRNVFCLGWNYAEHSREASHARNRDGNKLAPKEPKLPERPIFFTKATTSVIGSDAAIPAHADLTSQLDWEVELGLVIGKPGRDIQRGEAMAHVFGYTIINDVSARDIQIGHGGQFFKGKSLDGTCPVGPWIVTADEISNPHDLGLMCRVNGVIKQTGRTRDLIFDIPATIEWLSKGMTLLSGDLIATGTPSGVGFARTPPEFLSPGDVVECEVEGVGVLRNQVG